jgi:hypothetical protein
MQTTNRPRLSPVPNPISDALIDGFVDAREGRYCNAYPVGSDCWRAYEQSYCDECTAGAIRVRIAGGEPIHAIEADHDAAEPQPKRVGWFTWLMCLVCRNFARTGSRRA